MDSNRKKNNNRLSRMIAVPQNIFPMRSPKCLSFCTIILLMACCFTAKAQLQWNSNYQIGTFNAVYTYDYNHTPSNLVQQFPAVTGTGSVSYQWQYSQQPLGFYADIPGATSSSYVFTGPVAQTMYYKQRVTCSLGTIYSNFIRIEVVSVNNENLNYVREHTVLKPGIIGWHVVDNLDIGDKLQTTTYADGLGRTLQKVSRETATPSNPAGLWGDQVEFATYDVYGRQAVQNLSYTTTTQSGKYKTTAATEQVQYYTNTLGESSPFRNSSYDNSPLNRVINMKSPGTAWAAAAGNSVGYELNTTNENVQRWHIDYYTGAQPVNDGAYGENELFKTKYTDENGKLVIEYTNKSGQLVLKKIQLDEMPGTAHNGWICTYSIFDDFGLLRYRLQPEAVKYLDEHSWNFSGTDGQQVINELCFRYEYDEKGRNILKKVPGAKELRMLYDNRDRVMMMQDGNQAAKATPEWTVNVYDELDRVILTTLYKTNKTLAQLQTDIDNATATTITVTHNGSGSVVADLSVDTRVAGINYVATNTIEFITGFTSADGDSFTAEIDPNATGSGSTFTSTITASNNPISSSDMANSSVTTILKYLFYDTYNFAGARNFDNAFTLGYATDGDNIPALATSQRTLSFPTGTSTRVLGTTTFLNTTIYYNEDGLPIQQLEENIKSGIDITTSQYKFDGRLLSSYTKHSASGTGYTDFGILSKNLFDKLGRITELQQQYGTNTLTSIATYEYDDRGRLKTKHLAPGYTGSGKSELESLKYSYNIQGQITGINKDYTLKTAGIYSKWDNFFGMYLGFDNRDNVFAQSQLNGQVTGILWNTMGDDAQRRYDYTYDNAGRLSNALFTQKEKPTDGWASTLLDFSVSGSSGKIEYDLNGNIKAMLQKGVIPGGSPINIDDLQYTYASYSNKLVKVTDNSTAGTANGKLGDFKDGSNGTANDYVYDDNGNLVIDLNKEISAPSGSTVGITYNYLDKPEQVHIAGKGTLSIVYDADGNKLQRTYTPETGTAKTTTFIDRFVYEGNTLQYINFEEGRIRLITPVAQDNGFDAVSVDGNMSMPQDKKGVYDYFIRDYQQNVRMILTEETHATVATATMETSRASNEEPVFGQTGANNEVSQTRFGVNSIPGQLSGGGWNNSTIGSSVSRLSKLTNKIGPNNLIKVMAGDLVTTTTQYFYQNPASNSTGASPLTNVIQSLLQAITGSSATNAVTKGATANIGSQLNNSTPLNNMVAPDQDATDNIPKAYLSVLFFDERFNFVGEGSTSLRVGSAGNSNANLTLANIQAPKNGYAYIYVSNQSDEYVYFDNLKVAHTRGRIVEENHYYAFGLKIAAISSKKLGDINEGSLKNTHQYNDKELEDDGDVNWLDYGFRNYDAQIGRFVQIDPLTDEYDMLSGYHYALNDPIGNIDELGLSVFNVIDQLACPGSKVINSTLNTILTTSSLLVNALNIGGNYNNQQSQTKQAGKTLDGQKNPASAISQKMDMDERRAQIREINMSWRDIGDWNRQNDITGEIRSFRPREALGDDLVGQAFGFYVMGKIPLPKFGITKKIGSVFGLGALKKIATKEVNNIALGVREYLDDFARSVSGSTWKSWGTKDFQSQFLDVINNKSNKIHFNLDGINNPWGAITEGAKGFGKSRVTSWELYQLYSNPEVLGRTIFYKGGKVVANPF
ncbi:MAG: DUF6443 domain-containing protein [Bacteroidota bacterium]